MYLIVESKPGNANLVLEEDENKQTPSFLAVLPTGPLRLVALKVMLCTCRHSCVVIIHQHIVTVYRHVDES